MTRNEALNLLHKHLKNENLRRHCYAVEAVMRALAKRLNGNPDSWGIAGLLHDMDHETTKDRPGEHTHKALEWLKKYEVETTITDAILAHGWGYVDGNPKPEGKMQWALYCADELTGFIVAVALVKPDKKLSSVTVDSIKSKWGQKAFARGVHREQIEMCENTLGVPLNEFIEIALNAMQEIHEDLGL